MASLYTILSFSIFLIIFLGVGSLAARRLQKSDADYLLGSRSFGRYFVGLSAGATGNSGFIMVGAVGFGYMTGISSLLMLVACFLGEWIFWNFLSHKVSRFATTVNAQTVPEMLGAGVSEARGRLRVTALVGIISLVLVGAYAAAQFAAAGKTLNVFFGLSIEAGALIAAAAILCYCTTGGLRASIWTDIVQAFVVIIVSCGMLAIVVYAGGGAAAIHQQLLSIDPSLVDPFAGHTYWTLAAYLLGFMALGFGFDLSQPQVLVRLLAGRSPEEVRTAKWVYLGYVYLTWSVMTLFGIVCRVLIPEIGDPEQALPIYAAQNFHPLLVGVVLAGIFSVIASTADSQILVCSSALARDVSPSFNRKMSKRFGVRYQQFATILVGLLTVAAALCISSTVFTLILFAVGALAGSIGPAMLVVLLGWRTQGTALSLTMLGGLLTTVVWRLLGWHQVINEIAPGILAGLLIHALAMAWHQARLRRGGKGITSQHEIQDVPKAA